MYKTRGDRRLLPYAPSIRMGPGISGAALLLAILAVASPVAGGRSNRSDQAGSAMTTGLGDTTDRDVGRIRKATEKFTSLDDAVKEGYARVVPHCLANPPEGGMGYHHQNTDLLDDRLELERPEILVYERLPDGEYRFNGVEYVVPFSVWPTDRKPPRIMGRDLKPAPQLKIWYLHVWVWLENPSGLFADWNPRVQC
jgi:hypothetical protein